MLFVFCLGGKIKFNHFITLLKHYLMFKQIIFMFTFLVKHDRKLKHETDGNIHSLVFFCCLVISKSIAITVILPGGGAKWKASGHVISTQLVSLRNGFLIIWYNNVSQNMKFNLYCFGVFLFLFCNCSTS